MNIRRFAENQFVKAAILFLIVFIAAGAGTYSAILLQPKEPKVEEKVAPTTHPNDYSDQDIRIDGDVGFNEFARGPLNEMCPYYEPNGSDYRTCLSDKMEELQKSNTSSATKIKEYESYCSEKSRPFMFGNVAGDIYMSCMIYKLIFDENTKRF